MPVTIIKEGAESAANITSSGKAMIAGAGVAVSTPTGLWEWLGVHNESITALCAILGVLVTIGGFLVTVYKNPKPSADRETKK